LKLPASLKDELLMKKLNILIVLLFVSGAIFAQQTNPQNVNYIIQDSVLIPTRSGFQISATIVRKKGETQKLPAILFFTTYSQGIGDAIFAKNSVDRDYVGIVAYSRGIRSDLKNYTPYENESNDVYDVIDWISKQKWCSGSIGMYGGSYTGFVQWSAVKHIHPALKTIVPQVALRPGYDTPMENNVYSTSLSLNWSNNILGNEPLPNSLYDNWYKLGTSFRSLDSLAKRPNRIFQKWLQHPSYDSYWKSLVPTPKEYQKINIPILTTTGYYDGDQIGDFQYVKDYYNYNTNNELYVVIGPYDHRGGRSKPSPNLQGYKIDSVANIDINDLVYQWFDYVLKNGEKPKLLKDRINYEVMGLNKWKHVSYFNKMNNDTLTFYLGNNRIKTFYSLTDKKPNPKDFLAQIVDYKNRNTQNNYYTPKIVNDSLDSGNGLVFMTRPVEQSFSINGSFSGSLKLAINKKDVDISVALYELMPNGEYFYLTRYLGRASYANDNSKRKLLKPNFKEIIPFNNTRIVSKQINKGSRLIIILNVNKNPYDEINYGTGKNVGSETIKDAEIPIKIRWFIDSSISIPILK
jgi:putative CocE/NonD family hydrolase